jgi:8-oxo-dGTP pyrophosphatase MutT (NUDIX family)
MTQKYKFFINNKLLFLVENPINVDEFMENPTEFIVKPFELDDLQNYIEVILGDKNGSNWILYGAEVEKNKLHFFEYFKVIRAAGGVVVNEQNEIMLIHRRGFWDLPKGKMEKDETLEETAVREVIEETGISGITLLSPIYYKGLDNKCTFHSYFEKKKWILKESYWYRMETNFDGQLIPQTEEDIEQVKWVNKMDLPQYYDNMYLSIIEVLKNY